MAAVSLIDCSDYLREELAKFRAARGAVAQAAARDLLNALILHGGLDYAHWVGSIGLDSGGSIKLDRSRTYRLIAYRVLDYLEDSVCAAEFCEDLKSWKTRVADKGIDFVLAEVVAILKRAVTPYVTNAAKAMSDNGTWWDASILKTFEEDKVAAMAKFSKTRGKKRLLETQPIVAKVARPSEICPPADSIHFIGK